MIFKVVAKSTYQSSKKSMRHQIVKLPLKMKSNKFLGILYLTSTKTYKYLLSSLFKQRCPLRRNRKGKENLKSNIQKNKYQSVLSNYQLLWRSPSY
jgi:hypothetical protein